MLLWYSPQLSYLIRTIAAVDIVFNMEWTNELTLIFLENYACERVLWDSSEKSHKLKHKVHDAWKRISENMDNIPIDDLKTKKKSLMATFRPLLKKKKASQRSGAGADDVFQPIWFAFDTMESFLGKIYDVEETINTEDQGEQSEDTNMPPPSPCTEIQSQHSDQNSEPLPTQSNTKNPDATKTKAGRQRPTKKTDGSLIDAQQKINDSFNTLNNVLNRKREEDDCDVYAKLLAKRLRKYPERLRDRIMYKIDGLLLNNPPDERQSSTSPYFSSLPTTSPSYSFSQSPVHYEPQGIETRRHLNSTLHDYSIQTQTHHSQLISRPELTLMDDCTLPANSRNIYEIAYPDAFTKSTQ